MMRWEKGGFVHSVKKSTLDLAEPGCLTPILALELSPVQDRHLALKFRVFPL